MGETVEDILNDLICFEDPDTMLTISVDEDRSVMVASNDASRIAQGLTLLDALRLYRGLIRTGRRSFTCRSLTTSTSDVEAVAGATHSESDRMEIEPK